MIKTKKQMFIVIGVFALVLLLGSVSYAWFSYRAETGNSELVAGDIYMHMTEGNETLTLTNIFPETVEEARARDDNYITFEISGLNTSNKIIYYEILLNHGDDKPSPKSRYADSDLKFDLVELDDNGDEVTYVVDAASFDTLIDKRIWTDTIDASMQTEVSKKYKLRAWLAEDVIISDSEQDANYNTTEYPNKYATIKVKVNGDFQEKHVDYLYNIMKRQAVMDNINSDYVDNETPGINFGAVSSDTNGKGVYMRAGTENDTYPIMYYRGAVEDNNIVFNNKCWKAVRTTDTGGVKLIYNGESSAIYGEIPLTESQYTIPSGAINNFTFNSTDNTWEITITDNTAKEISFTVPAGDNYKIVQTGTSGSSTGGMWTFYKDGANVKSYGTGGGQPMNDTYSFGTLTASNVIKWTYTGSSSVESPITFKLQMIGPGDLITENGCNNTGVDTHISLSGTNTFAFNTSFISPAYNGYMYGTVYEYSSSNWTSGARFGSSFTWDGTNYTLVDDETTTPNATHHYSCNVTTASGTCQELRYVYYVSGSTKDYITLTGGDGIEEALVKMQTNTNNSNAKTQIDSWYASNMNTVTSKLEDTIWCNDRSIGKANGWSATGSWGSSYNDDALLYGAHERSNSASNDSTVKNQPSLACSNKNDAFTWKNGAGNQALDYPVGLLTEDEIVLAGGVSGLEKGDFYLNNGSSYWSLSPHSFNDYNANGFIVGRNGYIIIGAVYGACGLRPSVSLKPGTQVVSGSGAASDPFVIE